MSSHVRLGAIRRACVARNCVDRDGRRTFPDDRSPVALARGQVSGAPPEACGDDDVEADEDRAFFPGALAVVDDERADPGGEQEGDREQGGEDEGERGREGEAYEDEERGQQERDL